jgi:hypothetical protein
VNFSVQPGSILRAPRAFRIVVLILAITAFLTVSAAAASPAHFHLNSSPNGCNICFTAHTAAYEAPALHLFQGPELEGRATVSLPLPGYQAQVSRTAFSRGPPSSSR